MQKLVKGDLVHHKDNNRTYVVMEVTDDKVICKTKSGNKIFNISDVEKDEIFVSVMGIDNPFFVDYHNL
ncbi:hypothetical protein NDJ21_15525 [Vibrio alginolyticus]|uniref:hypothetical protein n=1 Tax=Vibrio alginolyticus TaxID=663 RepID=UPI00215F3CD2|nr:hypothetical protein [Vibrio alginolyticus]MCS0229422.1 hypothetical protein [Vibrio alginolyticus]